MTQDQEQEPRSTQEEELGIDLEEDLIEITEGKDVEQPLPEPSDEVQPTIANAGLDNVLDEFVEVLNARDLEALEGLLAPNAEASFLGEFSESGVLDGFGDLFLRYPTLLMTRGDIGAEPIVVAWLFEQGADRFDSVGYFTLDVSDSDEPQILRIEFGEELPDSDDLVVETPDRSDLQEWEDWSQLDED